MDITFMATHRQRDAKTSARISVKKDTKHDYEKYPMAPAHRSLVIGIELFVMISKIEALVIKINASEVPCNDLIYTVHKLLDEFPDILFQRLNEAGLNVRREGNQLVGDSISMALTHSCNYYSDISEWVRKRTRGKPRERKSLLEISVEAENLTRKLLLENNYKTADIILPDNFIAVLEALQLKDEEIQ